MQCVRDSSGIRLQCDWKGPLPAWFTVLPGSCFTIGEEGTQGRRALSVREALRASGAPDSFHFCQWTSNTGALEERYAYLVNAVPHALVMHVLERIAAPPSDDVPMSSCPSRHLSEADLEHLMQMRTTTITLSKDSASLPMLRGDLSTTNAVRGVWDKAMRALSKEQKQQLFALWEESNAEAARRSADRLFSLVRDMARTPSRYNQEGGCRRDIIAEVQWDAIDCGPPDVQMEEEDKRPELLAAPNDEWSSPPDDAEDDARTKTRSARKTRKTGKQSTVVARGKSTGRGRRRVLH